MSQFPSGRAVLSLSPDLKVRIEYAMAKAECYGVPVSVSLEDMRALVLLAVQNETK